MHTHYHNDGKGIQFMKDLANTTPWYIPLPSNAMPKSLKAKAKRINPLYAKSKPCTLLKQIFLLVHAGGIVCRRGGGTCSQKKRKPHHSKS